MSKVVTNTSPLIVLAKARMLEILPRIFDQIVAPEAVINEILAGPISDPMRQALPAQSWLAVVKLESPLPALAIDQLGGGEAEVIEYARQNPTWSVLVDDRAARRVATASGISVIGTLTVLALAADRKLVPSFDSAVRELRKAGLFVTDELVDSVRKRLER